MAAAVSSNGIPAWKKELRQAASLYRSCAEKGDLGGYFASYPAPLRTTYASVSLVSGSARPSAGPLPDDVLKSYGNDLTGEHEDTANDVKKVANSLKENKATKEDCKTRLQKAREEAKRKSSEIIDKQFDKVEAYLDTLPPEKQEKYTNMWIDFVNGFLSFWSKVLDLLWEVVKAVIDWLASVWEKIEKFFNDVKNTFIEAWEFVKSFFG